MHQFYAKEGPDEGAIAQYLMTAIGKYLDEMGVSRKLLDWASTVDSDSIQVIPYGMVVNFNLDNTRPHAAAWTLVGMDAESGASLYADRDTVTRFWRCEDGRGRCPILVHHHRCPRHYLYPSVGDQR